jgi:hypothetical protein
MVPYPGNPNVVVESLKALVTYGPLISYLPRRDAQVVGLAGAVLWNFLSASGLAGASALSVCANIDSGCLLPRSCRVRCALVVSFENHASNALDVGIWGCRGARSHPDV